MNSLTSHVYAGSWEFILHPDVAMTTENETKVQENLKSRNFEFGFYCIQIFWPDRFSGRNLEEMA